MKKQVKIVRATPLPKAEQVNLQKVNLSTLPDPKHDAICEHMREGVALAIGAKLAGYALVAWHMDGTITSAAWAARGVVGRSIAPALVHDVLLKRGAVQDTKEELEDEGRIWTLPK